MQPDDRPVRSYSQLTQLESCGEQYRLKRVERLPEQPAVWFPAGNAYHNVTESFDLLSLDVGLQQAASLDWELEFPAVFSTLRGELIDDKGADPDVSTWRTAGRPTKAQPYGEDVAWWTDNGPGMVRAYIDWRLKHADRYSIWVAADGTPGIEWSGTVELGGVPVTVRVDRVFVDNGTGATIVVDLKSGKYEPDSPLQLRIYRSVIERATAEPMWYGAYFMARAAKLTTPIPLDNTNELGIEGRFERAEQAITAGIFTPRPSPSNCRQCGWKSHCLFVED